MRQLLGVEQDDYQELIFITDDQRDHGPAIKGEVLH